MVILCHIWIWKVGKIWMYGLDMIVSMVDRVS
jgi:hypothetical protein